MIWGTFGPVHILTLVLGAVMVVGLYYGLKKASRKVQTLVLGVLSFSGIAAIVYNLVMWGSPLEYLPLHLCSINAILLPIVVFTRSKTLGNLLLVWSLGAAAALVMNQSVASASITSSVFFFYYFPHVMEFGIPILLFKLGLVKKDPRCIGSTIGITMAIYTLVHCANLALNTYCAANKILADGAVIKVNYMFSITPENPLLAAFYKVIPHPYWYMYMIVPILVVYLLVVYAPQLRKRMVHHASLV